MLCFCVVFLTAAGFEIYFYSNAASCFAGYGVTRKRLRPASATAHFTYECLTVNVQKSSPGSAVAGLTITVTVFVAL